MSEDLEQRKVDRSEEEEEEEDSSVSDEDETESEEEEDEDDEFGDPEGYVDDITDEGMCVRLGTLTLSCLLIVQGGDYKCVKS